MGSAIHVRLLDWRRSSVLQKAWCLAVTCGILLMFFVPLPHGSGSFQQTNGPTSALRSMRSAQLLLLSMAAFVLGAAAAALPSTVAMLICMLLLSASHCRQRAAFDPVLTACEIRC